MVRLVIWDAIVPIMMSLEWALLFWRRPGTRLYTNQWWHSSVTHICVTEHQLIDTNTFPCCHWTETGLLTSQIARAIGSMSIRYRYDAKVSDRYLIDVDPMVFAIGDVDNWTKRLTLGIRQLQMYSYEYKYLILDKILLKYVYFTITQRWFCIVTTWRNDDRISWRMYVSTILKGLATQFDYTLHLYVHVRMNIPWWRHQMERFSASLVLCQGNPPVTGGFPSQGPVRRSFGVFFDLHPNKRLNKQRRRWWFETLSRSLWRHRNASYDCPSTSEVNLEDVGIVGLARTIRNHNKMETEIFLGVSI